MCDHVLLQYIYLLCYVSFLPVPARSVMCDMLKGSVERIIRSSYLLRLINRLRLISLIVVHQDTSYTVDTQVRVQLRESAMSNWQLACFILFHCVYMHINVLIHTQNFHVCHLQNSLISEHFVMCLVMLPLCGTAI